MSATGEESELGPAGERVACRYLRDKGYKILARGFRCPYGEIDVVALDRDTIVFVEVKTRSDERAADLEEAVRPAKIRRLTRAAKVYLQRKRVPDHPARFDFVGVILPRQGRPVVRHAIDAFQPG